MGYCVSVSSLLNKRMGTICIGSFWSIVKCVELSAIALVLKYIFAVFEQQLADFALA